MQSPPPPPARIVSCTAGAPPSPSFSLPPPTYATAPPSPPPPPRDARLRCPPSRPPPTAEGRGLPSSAEGCAPPPRASPIPSSADRRGPRASAYSEGNPNPSRHQAMPTKGHSKKTKALGTPGICAHVHVGCSCPRWLITCSSYYFCSSHMFASRFFHVTNCLVSCCL